MPELAEARRRRFVTAFALPEYDAAQVTQSAAVADFFESVVRAGAPPKAASNWMMGELARALNAAGLEINASPVTPEALAALVGLIDKGTISGAIAKTVFEKMFATGRSAADIVAAEADPDRRRWRDRGGGGRRHRRQPGCGGAVSRRQGRGARVSRRAGDEGDEGQGESEARQRAAQEGARRVIETQRLSKLYGRGVYALRELTLTIDKGEFLFLTGPSGAGKSTFLRLLLREERPTEGTLIVAGRNLEDLSASQVQSYRRSVGFVFQDFRLIPRLTVFQNVAFVMRVLGVPVAVQQRKTFQVLKWVGLQHRMNALPEELSGGEQQRVAIARALVNDPQLVLADEPTGNLDPDLALEIMNLFREINARGTTVVVATHDRELIRRVGRRAITLAHGRVVEVT
jgi:cell division transport system ATP-binding protein